MYPLSVVTVSTTTGKATKQQRRASGTAFKTQVRWVSKQQVLSWPSTLPTVTNQW